MRPQPDKGHRALRKGRVSLPGHVYLVTTVTRDRQPVFANPTAAWRVARILGDSTLWSPHRCLCWVLMPDHWHGLLQLGETGDLSSAMRTAKNMSARQLIRPQGTARRLWADGFHDRALRRDDDIRAVARYIIANPLRAGLTSDILAYPYWDSVWLSPTVNPDIAL